MNLDLGKSKTRAPNIGRSAARGAIRAYQLTLSALAGSQCRHLPTCSAYMDEAIARHGLWAGGFMGLARLCRCQPLGTAGFDPVPVDLPANADLLRPWRYGRWRGPLPEGDWPDSRGGAGPAAAPGAVNAGDQRDAARRA
jgi:putative membrane protein insertion efficiency factor